MIDISVVVPTGRDVERIRACVESCTLQNHDRAEFLLVVNPPSEAHERWVESIDDPRVRYLGCEERSANAARNIGLAEARGDVVYFLDDDCHLPDSDHLNRVVELHERHPDVLGIGGPYLSLDDAAWSARAYNAYTELWLRRNQTAEQRQLVLLGGNASYKRAMGGEDLVLDGALAYGGTETEFNHRLVCRDHTLILLDDHAVIHDFRENVRKLLWRAWRQGAGRRANPYEARAQDRRVVPREISLLNDPRPRWAFRLFTAVYYLSVCGGARWGEAPVRDPATPPVAMG